MSKTRPDCRICLAAPAAPGADFLALMEAALDADDVASLVLPAPHDGDGALIARCLAAAQERGVATLIDTDIEAAKSLGADGVHLKADAKAFALARGLLGPSGIIGVDCALSRHDALTFGEKGADYIAFSGPAEGDMERIMELIEWWADIVVVPCVAWHVSSPPQARMFAEAGVDFVSASPAIWTAEGGVAAAVEALNAAIRRDPGAT